MIKTPLKLFADCIVEKGITAYSAMDNYVHSHGLVSSPISTGTDINAYCLRRKDVLYSGQ